MKNTYLELHKLFLAKPDDEYYRTWMLDIVKSENMSCSTDGHVLFATPKLDLPQENETSKISSIFSINNLPKPSALLDKTAMLKAFKNIPLVDEIEILQKETECGACYGSGEVDYVFDYNCSNYTKSDDCPLCDGSGEIEEEITKKTGNKVLDPKQVVKIGNSHFYYEKVKHLSHLSDKLNSEILIISTDSNKLLAKIEECYILIMGCILKDSYEKTIVELNTSNL